MVIRNSHLALALPGALDYAAFNPPRNDLPFEVVMVTYCVFLCRHSLDSDPRSSRTKSCFLSASTATLAMTTAAEENAQYRPIGVEPGSFAIQWSGNMFASRSPAKGSVRTS